MKIMNKLQNRKDQIKKNNKGFSLVELIIVIAIMAILVGIVGTQVIPYLNKSKESKDEQIVNSYSTAGMTAYSSNAGNEKMPTTGKVVIDVYGTTKDSGLTDADFKKALKDSIIELVGYKTIGELQTKMTSKEGKTVSAVTIEIDFDNKLMTTQAYGTSGEGDDAVTGAILEKVESQM